MTRYISLAEYFWLAEQVTGIEAAVITKSSRAERSRRIFDGGYAAVRTVTCSVVALVWATAKLHIFKDMH